MSRSDGVKGIVRGALAGASSAIADDEDPQGNLMGELLAAMPPSRFDAGHGQGEKARNHVIAAHRARGAGRPAGAQNLATRDVKAYVQRLFGDPMIESARMAMHTPLSLSIELSCTLLEAARFLEDIRKDLRRYFYAPMAAVDDQGRAVTPQFALLIGGQAVGAEGGAPPWLTDPEVRGALEKEQQNQRVIDAAAEVSHDGKSHDGD